MNNGQTMAIGDLVVMQQDASKTFTVTEVGHWSTIVADDGTNESYSVKWYGCDSEGRMMLVGVNGPTFTLWS